MIWTVSKLLIASSLITLTSWLAGRKPGLAGFLMALPVSSMIALAFSYADYRDPKAASAFAKSIFLAVPLSLTFFLPFLLAERLKWKFEFLYLAGVVLLAISYGLHRWAFRS